MTTFDLRAAVRHVLDTTDLADPRDIATKVAENVPANQRIYALTTALDPYVREAIQRRRNSNPIIGSASPRTGSSKVAAIQAYARALRDQVHVGAGAWKPLGDCTYDDLMFAAEERREHARQNAAAAERYQTLADLVRDEGAARVADLPVEVLRDRLGGAS